MKRHIKLAISTLAALAVLALALSFSSLTLWESFRVTFGSVYVLFVPGFILTFVFFPLHHERGIDWLERIALSFALSIAIVPLVVFYLNLIGLRISAFSTFFTILGIIIVSFAIIYFRRNRFTGPRHII